MFVASQSFPAAIRSWDHMAYGFRRWNPAVCANVWVDRYNVQLDLIRCRFDEEWHVDDHERDRYRTLTISTSRQRNSSLRSVPAGTRQDRDC